MKMQKNNISLQKKPSIFEHKNFNSTKLARGLGALAIAVVIVIYSYNYFNNTFPYSEGWFVNYVELVKRGQFPYRDFFYYLPPLNLLIDYIFWKLSFGYLLIFRAWYLLERIVLYILVYRLLCKFFDWKKASLACCFAAVLCTADDFDFFGDYNQNVALLTVIIIYFAVGFAQEKKVKKKIKNLFFAGMILGMMMLTKQTIFIACIAIFFPLLVLFCAKEHDRNFISYFLSTIIGTLIPIIVCAVILSANGALIACIDQLFSSADGKGSIFDILVTYLLMTLKHWHIWIFALIMFGVYWLEFIIKPNINQKKVYIFIGIVAAIFVKFEMGTMETITSFLKSFENILGIFIISIVPFLIMCVIYLFARQYYSHKVMIYTLLFAVILQCSAVMFVPSMYYAIYDIGIYSLISQYFNNTIFYFLIIYFIVLLVNKIKNKELIQNQNEIIMIAGGGLALNYATTMAAGLENIASNSMRISLPLVLVIIFSSNLKKDSISRWLKYLISIICVIGIMACIAQKSITAYPWWGMKDSPKEEKTYTVDIPALKGIYFSEIDKEMYEEITSIIDKNTDEDAIIFGYPYIKIYNILCERYNNYSVPVFWYDVVGDKYVDILIKELNKQLPDIVLWYDIPNALETHEEIYRNGKPLEQRKIVSMFDEILPKKYKYLGTYNDISVYKLKEK